MTLFFLREIVVFNAFGVVLVKLMMRTVSISVIVFFFFSSRRRHTRYWRDWSSDVCSSDLSTIQGRYRIIFIKRVNITITPWSFAVLGIVLEEDSFSGIQGCLSIEQQVI